MRELSIGQAVQFMDAVGYIASIEDNDGGGCSHVIGAGGMQEIKHRIRIVFTGENPHVSENVAEQQAEQWADRAAHLPNVDPDKLPDLIEVAELAQQERREKALTERSDKERQRAEFVEKYREQVPEWAKGVIVAHRHINESDPMSDYHGHRVGESIILAFSKHERNLFPELRKAAARAEETSHLATKPTCPPGREEFWTPEDEHRENYSMGGGTYLGVYKDSDGWVVQKNTMYSGDDDLMTRIPVGRWAVPPEGAEPAPRKVGKSPLLAADYSGLEQRVLAHIADGAGIEEHYHTKRGITVQIVVPSQRVDREEYIRLLDEAKKLGGWYSRAWRGTPGGYAFKELATAERFLAEQYSSAPDDLVCNGVAGKMLRSDRERLDRLATTPCQAQKFRTLADTLQIKIDDKMSDRLENTAKRMAQAAHARLEGRRLERTQSALRALANLHEAGEVPEILAGIKNRAAIHEHMGSKLSQVANGFHGYSVETGEPHSDDPIAVALWALLDAPDPERERADKLAQMVRDLHGCKIPGYFPTPDPVIDIMLEHACLEPYHHVLEPEAGSGDIADRVAEVLGEDGIIQVHETQHSLCEILTAKGYDARPGDFLEFKPGAMKFDRVLMNPPFENLQDVAHVVHAAKFLKPGGVLVAVMSPGPFFRNDQKCEGFRTWCRIKGAEVFDLPAGSFKTSGTTVATKLLVVHA